MADRFRLKMATQLGEKIAKDFGYTDFHVDPVAIAKRKGIAVQAKPANVKGISGALIFAGSDATIVYSSEYDNAGFENFCVAHELGHYFMPGHPEEIRKQGGQHFSKADFTQGSSSIELEADHFASGLLLPSTFTKKFLSNSQIGLAGILGLAAKARCSRTAAAIRAAQCSEYPLAIVVSESDKVAYAFLSDGFKALGQLAFLKKGSPLPASLTRKFNAAAENALSTNQACAETTLADWFGADRGVGLDEEVIGLGKYGYTLTVLSSEQLPNNAEEDEDDEAQLEKNWDARFAYGR